MRTTAVLTLAVILAACSQTVELTDADDGSSVQVEVGDEFTIELPANPTTGYQWVVAPFDANVVEQVGETSFEPESDALGAPGTMTWTFEARASGRVELTMNYERSVETEEPIDTWTVVVTVS